MRSILLLLIVRTYGTYDCGACGTLASDADLCSASCKCSWCTSTDICSRLIADCVKLRNDPNTNEYIINTTLQIEGLCKEYSSEDWSAYWTSYLDSNNYVYCYDYRILGSCAICNRLCKKCNTDLICNNTKNIIQTINNYNDSIQTIANNILNYCSNSAMFIPIPYLIIGLFGLFLC